MENILTNWNNYSGLLTLLTVLSSFIACIISLISAIAAWAQVREMRKQYAEDNRPIVEVEFIFLSHSFLGLRFINHGKCTAQNVEIQLSNEFITSLKNERFTSALNKQKGKKCVIGVGQHYDLFFADVSYLQLTQKLPATGTVLYENNGTKYQQDFEIDMENYATIFSVESNEEKFLKAFKEQTRQIENIKQGIRDIARNTKPLDNTEESK